DNAELPFGRNERRIVSGKAEMIAVLHERDGNAELTRRLAYRACRNACDVVPYAIAAVDVQEGFCPADLGMRVRLHAPAADTRNIRRQAPEPMRFHAPQMRFGYGFRHGARAFGRTTRGLHAAIHELPHPLRGAHERVSCSLFRGRR